MGSVCRVDSGRWLEAETRGAAKVAELGEGLLRETDVLRGEKD